MELIDIVSGFIKYVLTAFLMYGVFILIERLRPAEPHQPFKHILLISNGMLFILIAFAINAVGIGALVGLTRRWFGGPYLTFPEPHIYLKNCWCSALFLDCRFFYYWFHRLQHTNSFLWEQHKFHHSETSLNVTSTRRVHWLEEPLVMAFIVIPMSLLFRIEPIEVGFLAFIEILWLQFIHLNLRLELGVFNSVIVGPQHHRNFTILFSHNISIKTLLYFSDWDICFGSYNPW
ncbi:MAG: sterol desaturase family protein [Richelia sp. SM1_7_0]|nr:sterol desaturase family protein [Richelia sp. SM1_7_0]